MEEVFKEIGFNPYDYIKGYNDCFTQNETDFSKYEEPSDDNKAVYLKLLNYKLEKFRKKWKDLSGEDLGELLEQYELIKNLIHVRYYSRGEISPDPTYDGYKQLSFDKIVLTFIENVIVSIKTYIDNPVVKVEKVEYNKSIQNEEKLFEPDFNKMDLSELKEYFNGLGLPNVILKEMTSDFMLDNLICLTEPNIKNNNVVYLTKEGLVKFIKKGFYGDTTIEKIVLQNYNTNRTGFRVYYYNFYLKSLDLLKVRFFKNYKGVLVKVLFDCISTIEQVELDDKMDFEKNLKDFTKKIALKY